MITDRLSSYLFNLYGFMLNENYYKVRLRITTHGTTYACDPNFFRSFQGF